ncbi:MAG: hypothetical protein H6978_01415 [Gammaproteobacteria bacterium]|nr:hypothetical protein [Gammaproteobacteria bacterium]
MGRRQVDSRELRAELAHLSARLLAEGGAADFQSAKRKAAEQLGVGSPRAWPENLEVQQALMEYQQLFEPEALQLRLRRMRECALVVMDRLVQFEPCLVGPALYGTACEDTPVTLHIFSDEPEAVVRALIDQRIPFDEDERRLRVAGSQSQSFPMFSFAVDTQEVELVVFPSHQGRDRPLSPLDGKPMQRADRAKVEALLNAADVA